MVIVISTKLNGKGSVKMSTEIGILVPEIGKMEYDF